MQVRITAPYVDSRGAVYSPGDVVELEEREAISVLNSGAAKPASSRVEVESAVELGRR